MAEFTKLVKKNDVVPGKLKSVYVSSIGANVVVVSVEGKYYAFKDECPHRAVRLSNGNVEGNVITCPEHSSKFDMTTGKPLAVADSPLEMYEVKAEGDDVFVKV
jgi:nitrite reductase/ring-hydroxylating ferredoxin subunit